MGLAVAAIVAVWGFVLPRLEQSSQVQTRIKNLEERGIDPAAFFYSDHEGMSRWEAKIRRAQRQDPTAFW